MLIDDVQTNLPYYLCLLPYTPLTTFCIPSTTGIAATSRPCHPRASCDRRNNGLQRQTRRAGGDESFPRIFLDFFFSYPRICSPFFLCTTPLFCMSFIVATWLCHYVLYRRWLGVEWVCEWVVGGWVALLWWMVDGRIITLRTVFSGVYRSRSRFSLPHWCCSVPLVI